MTGLSTNDLLTAWETGHARHPVDRALVLLSFASPGTAPALLAELSIGERNAHLMQLRELTFGPDIRALADCPSCGESIELDSDTNQLTVAAPDEVPLSLDVDGYRVAFRLPTSSDLAAVRAAPDVATARHNLLERCSSGNVPAGEMPETLKEAIAAAMEHADPQSEVRLALECPACGRHWEELFDVASFLWTEVNAWALRALRDVHQLASAYGWGEAEILAMTPCRRQVYLEMTAG